MTITPHEFHWYIQALMQKQQLTAFMEKPLDTLAKGSAEYMEAYRFNSYIKLSKVKLNWNKIEVKVRIPEFPEGQAQLDAIWDKVVKKIYRMNNGVFTLSNYKNSDPNYYIVEGTRV